MMEEALELGAEPGLRVFYGHSGWGKTWAVTACAIQFDAAYVCAIEGMTRKSLLTELLGALGNEPQGRTVYELTKEAARALLASGRAVIVDEADQLMSKGILNTLRAVHDQSQAAVVLVGEERLPEKLEAFERVHNRVIGFHPAQPCTIEDAVKMAAHFARGLQVAPDLVEAVVTETAGVTRRVRANFIEMRKVAHRAGEEAIDLAWWQAFGTGFFTGAKPVRARGAR